MSSILSSILGGAPSAGHSPLPPDLMAALHGQDGGQGAEPQSAPKLLSQALDLLSQYMKVEPDEADKVTVSTCITNLQKVRAKDQQEADKAMQGNSSPRMVRKAAAAQGGSPAEQGGGPGGAGY